MSDETEEYDEAEPIGWDAIDAALAPIYEDREPQHYGPVVPAMLGGDDPLQGISAYKNLTPIPHYHSITYGFSELYEKESDDPDFSGFGFELTLRLACDADESEEPPMWPLNFLQNIARYVFSTGNAFDERHHMTLNGPIAIGHETQITAILLTKDPQLQEMNTQNGQVKFLQVVGLCEDEYRLIQDGYFEPVASRVTELTPFAITNIHRPSILQDKSTLDEITSSEPKVTQSEIFGTVAEWEESGQELVLRIGATLIGQTKALLTVRLAKGEPIAIYGKGTGIIIEPDENNSWKKDGSLLVISMTTDTAEYLGDHLQPDRGKYECGAFPNLRIEVVPIEIKDSDGNVVKTVG